MEGDYTKIFGFVQWVLRHEAKPYEFEMEVSNALRICRAACVFRSNVITDSGGR
jgi:hypothetical protein